MTASTLGACRAPLRDARVVYSLGFPDTDPGAEPLLIGRERGMFAAAGLVLWEAAREAPREAAPDVQFLGAAQLHRLETEKPGGLKVLSFGLQRGGMLLDAILIRDEPPVLTVAALRKRPIVPLVGGGTSAPRLATLALVDSGLPAELFKPTPAALAELDQLPWLVAYAREPILSLLRRDPHLRILVPGSLVARYVLDPWPGTAVALVDSFAQERPEVAAAFVRVYDETLAWMRAHPDERKRLWAAHVGKAFELPELITAGFEHVRSDEVSVELLRRQAEYLHAEGKSGLPDYAQNLRWLR